MSTSIPQKSTASVFGTEAYMYISASIPDCFTSRQTVWVLGAPQQSESGGEEKNSLPEVETLSAISHQRNVLKMSILLTYEYITFGSAIAQAVSCRLPTAVARVRARVRFSPNISVYPANLHSTNCSTITLTYNLGLLQ
jgi:hypothetical protein